jgi:hypothetical protein
MLGRNQAVMGKKVFWYFLKIIGMLFVCWMSIVTIKNTALFQSLTGDSTYLVLSLFISAGLVYWAYRVIWKPIGGR